MRRRRSLPSSVIGNEASRPSARAIAAVPVGLLAALLISHLAGCAAPALVIGHADATRLYRERPDILFIDVRTSAEVRQEGRLRGALWLALDDGPGTSSAKTELIADAVRQYRLDPRQAVVIFCARGIRARETAEALARQGFSRVAVLHDGLWAAGSELALELDAVRD